MLFLVKMEWLSKLFTEEEKKVNNYSFLLIHFSLVVAVKGILA